MKKLEVMTKKCKESKFSKFILFALYSRCKKDYIGNPLQGCRRECDSSRDCTPQQECEQFKCVAACREGGIS